MTKLVEDMARLHERSVGELVTSTNLGKAVNRMLDESMMQQVLEDLQTAHNIVTARRAIYKDEYRPSYK
jgi:hypothetical protein